MRRLKAGKVWSVYFSATGTTEKIVRCIAAEIATERGCDRAEYDFTLPQARQSVPPIAAEDIVVCGTPVYAGRVPNLMLPYIKTLRGNGAAAIPIVLFGNRDYDDALIELRDLLTADGFMPVAAAAFVGEHAFSDTLAAGRPDAEDMAQARAFAKKAAALPGTVQTPVTVSGTPAPYRGYYQPRDRAGKPIDIRKVTPKTKDSCDHCGLCARVCPMGSIDPTDESRLTGICIKCGACVKKCPHGAKYYDDAGYLYHKSELELGYARRAENSVFLG